jgi:SAM-dependent methyltransferase
LLVPIWNGGHRIGWLLRDYLTAIAFGRWERCPVCGRVRLMIYRRRVIPPRLVELWGLSPTLAEAFARKESSDCSGCGAKLRARRLARVLLTSYPGHDGRTLPSIRDWVDDPRVRRLRIAEINRIDGLHEQLSRLPDLAYSDYAPGQPPGSAAGGVRSEDLTRLTYADEQFDLVVTSESLEHVPDLARALREIHRVLKPGGTHIFTIPQVPGVPKTFARTVLRDDGSPEHLAPPIRHPGGDVGYPVFTEVGADFPDYLNQAGFQVEVFFGPNRDHDVAQVYSTRKPGCLPDPRSFE